jgi:hypothetical protein
MDNYGMNNFAKQWEEVLDNVVQNCGSWESRKNYKTWELTEIK